MYVVCPLEGVTKEFWGFKATLFLDAKSLGNVQANILPETIYLLAHFLLALFSHKNLALKLQNFLFAPSNVHQIMMKNSKKGVGT